MKITRIGEMDSNLIKYKQLLTSFAYNELLNEYQFYQNGVQEHDLNTTDNSCDCEFFVPMGLPCRHIFHARSSSVNDLYDEGLCLNRWKKEYLYSMHPAYKEIVPIATTSKALQIYQTTRTVDEFDKFKTVSIITKEICEKLSTVPMDIYEHFKNKLQIINTEIDNVRSDNRFETDIQDATPIAAQEEFIPNSQGSSTNDFIGFLSQEMAVIKLNESDSESNEIHENPDLQSSEIETEELNYKTIVMPKRNIKMGRPKNEGRTVIGLKRKCNSKYYRKNLILKRRRKE